VSHNTGRLGHLDLQSNGVVAYDWMKKKNAFIFVRR
jgi:hypothetical protein